MIAALENNVIGQILAGVCAALLLTAIGLMVVWVLPASPDSASDQDEDLQDVEVASVEASKPFEQYAEIYRRPVFNEDRRPAPVEEGESEPELVVEEDIGAPEVELAGVVITPSLRMATLRSKEHKHSLVAFEGKPLEGDFGTWQVSRIAERKVTLASADGQEMELELQVYDSVITEPPEPAREPAAAGAQEVEEDENAERAAEQEEQLSRAEEIRRRIEQRREELRRQAEESQANDAENYSDAIQSMIRNSERRREERNN